MKHYKHDDVDIQNNKRFYKCMHEYNFKRYQFESFTVYNKRFDQILDYEMIS